MKLCANALAGAAGIVWGGAMLLAGAIHLADHAYAVDFLGMMSSLYPGFAVPHNVIGVIVGTLYGFADGAIAGLICAWLYNSFATHSREQAQWHPQHATQPAANR